MQDNACVAPRTKSGCVLRGTYCGDTNVLQQVSAQIVVAHSVTSSQSLEPGGLLAVASSAPQVRLSG